MGGSRRKVFVARRHFLGVEEARLRAAGFDIFVGPRTWYDGTSYDSRELANLARDADAMLVSPWEVVDGAMIAACPRLQAVVCAVIGVDKIDQDAATAAGVLVCNSPATANFVGVAEATVGLIVALMKGLKRNEHELRSGGWYKVANRGMIMAGRSIGFVGLGRIARETARRLNGWGINLLGYDPYVTAEAAREFGIESVTMDRLLRESDVVSLHVVLTRETRNMIGMEELRKMKREAYLVNTSRGGVINETDLARALEEGVIAGAALDVFDHEPLEADSPLRRVDPTRLIMTPHIIGHDRNVEESGFIMAVETIESILKGNPPQTVVNHTAVDRWRARFWS
jgi:D-3-phosphoglycerate dehydrogenase